MESLADLIRMMRVKDHQVALFMSPDAHIITLEQVEKSVQHGLYTPISGDHLRARPGTLSIWDHLPDAGKS